MSPLKRNFVLSRNIGSNVQLHFSLYICVLFFRQFKRAVESPRVASENEKRVGSPSNNSNNLDVSLTSSQQRNQYQSHKYPCQTCIWSLGVSTLCGENRHIMRQIMRSGCGRNEGLCGSLVIN